MSEKSRRFKAMLAAKNCKCTKKDKTNCKCKKGGGKCKCFDKKK
jgi:hypothetical protein